MKSKVVVLSFILCYIVVCAYKDGPGTNGYDCTGAETGLGNPTGCTCHNAFASSGISVMLELDSAGLPTTHYVGGATYTVKLSGVNNGSSSQPKFGFQVASILGATAKTTPVNVGLWSSPLPVNTHLATPQPGFFVVKVAEHTIPIPASTGSGGNGSTYSESFTWTAPVSGTGTISFWAALNTTVESSI